jgi:uncharacterized membrane protein
MNTPTLLVFIGLVVISLLGHFLPRFTRPDVFFGVTVDPAFRTTDTARRMLRDYRFALWGTAIATGGLIGVFHRPMVAFLLYVAGTCGAQMASHRRALIHATPPSTAIEVDLSAPKEEIPGGLLVTLLPFVVLIGLGAWAIRHMDRLPDRLAVHWGFGGPNQWVITSSRAIIILLVQHEFVCLVLTAMALAVLHWSRRISVSGPAAAAERRFRRRTVLLALTAEYFSILPPAFSLLQAPAFAMKVWSATLFVTLFVFFISLMRAGQGGARRGMAAAGAPIGDRTADAHWIGGLIYFNRTDPALLVEKRMGIGWTLNLGNPWSWVLLIGVVVVVVTGPMLMQGASKSAVAGAPLQPDDRVASPKTRIASPGTEESLRRYIHSLEEGHPNYEEMSPELAASVNLQLPKIMTIIAGLGGFSALTYQGTDSEGSDVYVAEFARGRLEWHIGPLVDGKVTYRYFRRLP